MLGVTIMPTSDDTISSGARVVEVVDDGPATDADLEPDDIITAVDGKTVTDPGSLSATVREYPAGSDIELTVVRDGDEFTETLELGGTDEHYTRGMQNISDLVDGSKIARALVIAAHPADIDFGA